MTLAQMQARFFELKGKLAVGQIAEQEFKQELERLRFQDPHGRWWMIGAQSGRWYYYDGARWLLGEPPEPNARALYPGEQPVAVIPPAVPQRPTPPGTAHPAANAAPGSHSAQTISVPYTYAPSPAQSPAPAPTFSTSPAQPAPPLQAAAPAPRNGGNGYAPPTPAANTPAAPSPSSKPSLGAQLHQELGRVRMPHVEVPHIQRPNLDLSHQLPPQLVTHTPAQLRRYQPPFILIGAIVIGLTLLALLGLAADNFVPGKPISNFFGRALGGGATAFKTPPTRPPAPALAGNVSSLLQVGDELASKSQFEPALAQYQAAAKYAPNDANVYTHWARALALTGRISEAISTAQKATKLDPTSANAYAELTRALAWAGQTTPAINAGEKGISLDPQNATVQALLAEAYLRAGRSNDAQQAVDKALELDDSNPETHRAAGWIAILAGRKDEGVGEWNRVIELAPDIFMNHYELGLVYAEHLNDPGMAVSSFDKAIQLYPPYIPSYTALGRAYLATNQPGAAILQFQKALTLDPNSSDAFLGLGQAFQQSQKCPQAIPYFNKALELNKSLVQATTGLEDCGAIAKGSAAAQAPSATPQPIAPVATALPQGTVAPLSGGGNSQAPKLTPPAGPVNASAGSPGKGRIYFPVYDGQYRVYSANPDGSDRRLVTELASSPAVGPDGKSMLFYSWESSQRGIHRIGTDGADDLHISLRAEDTLPSWSPDGAKYVYATRAGLGGDINKRAFTIRVASTGSKPRQDPAPLIEQAQYPAWGPENTIAFRDCGFPSDICGLAIVNADGSGKTALTPSMNATAPAWSPDGSRIVFMSNAAGNWDLYTVSADGGSPERLTDDQGDDGLPVWSPDGRRIAFVTKRDGKWSIWGIDPDGSNEVKLFDLGGDIAGPIPGNSSAQPGQVWTDQRLAWR